MRTVYFSPDYAAAAHAFDTTRKAQWVADSLSAAPIEGIALRAPEPLSAAQLETIHDAEYVRAVQTGEPRRLAEAQGFSWDPQLWTMACASTGGALAAAREARSTGVAGSLSSGLHHARRRRGAAYCTFNGLALAAKTVLDDGANRVLILDLDAHCGGGTYSLIHDDDRITQTDISTNSFDNYHPTTPRVTLDIITDASTYLTTIERRLAALDPRFDLCLYNAGMDCHEDCTAGGLAGLSTPLIAERERLVFDWCRRQALPIAFVLAGGYVGGALTQQKLVDLHRLTIKNAAL